MNTETAEGRAKRLKQLVGEYEEKGNKVALVRLVGGSVDDFSDYSPIDAGEPPKGAKW